MTKIHLLSEDIIAQIAAGQVVERPAFAVKELIENSIDAQANSIEIRVVDSGLKEIIVTDNGVGMNKEDVDICYKKHTTSKISSIEDLHNISSIGFRGEALSSIGSVSKTTISSKEKNAVVGNMIVIHNGIVEESRSVGMPVGTQVHIEKLFASLPVRQKFLKSKTIELRHITDIISRYALAYPSIRFIYSHNGNTIFSLPKEQNILDRISLLLGENISKQLIPINLKDKYFTITGYVVHPQQVTETTNRQYLFVNERPIRCKNISAVIKESYGTLLNPHSQPIFILFINLPYDMVDVNVHPRKEEISFFNEESLLMNIKKAVTESLRKSNLAFVDTRWQGSDEKRYIDWQVRDGNTKTYAATLLKNRVVPINKTDINTQVIQLHNTYLLFQNNEGIVLIDQHAAHERILYEKFRTTFENERKRTSQYVLPKPLLLDFSIEDSFIINGSYSVLLSMGITIESLGNVTYRVSTVPYIFKDRNIEELIREMINDLSQSHKIKSIDLRSERMLTYLACRSAAKAGDILTKEQILDIISQLEEVPNRYTCPHGRPTQYNIPLVQLEKMFKRR
jgi:DNA mismatch repair protein MutL